MWSLSLISTLFVSKIEPVYFSIIIDKIKFYANCGRGDLLISGPGATPKI